MSEENRALAKRWFEEVWNRRRTETVDELLAQEGVGHMEGGDVRGPEAFKAVRADLLRAFPDMRGEIEDTVAEGDHVVIRWNVRGTHGGEGLGAQPTGRSVDFRGMTWMTFRGGKLIEGWDSWNLGLLLQRIRTETP